MKKRANLITRVALAATIFVTALAGVTPMTAMAATYTITFDKGDGGSGTGPNAITTEEGGTFTFPENTFDPPAGKQFKSWIMGPNEYEPKSTTTVGSDMIAYAKWENVLTGIKVATEPTKKTYHTGETFDPAGMVVKAVYGAGTAAEEKDVTYDYTPKGALAKTDTKIVIFFTEDGKTVYAEQAITVTDPEPVAFRVNYEYNGGTRNLTKYPNTYDSNVTNLSTYTLRDAPTRDGYEFIGWALASDASATVTALTAAMADGTDINLTAVWTSSTQYQYTATPSPATVAKSTATAVEITIVSSPAGSAATVSNVHDGTDYLKKGEVSQSTDGKKVFIDAEYVKALTKDTTFTITMSDGGRATAKLTISSGTATTIKSFEWTSNGATLGSGKLGDISTSVESFHEGSSGVADTVIHLISSTKEFENGTTVSNIKSDINKSNALRITVEADSNASFTKEVDWDYDYTKGESKNFGTYNVNTEEAQTFYLYSKPIKLEKDNKVYLDKYGDKTADSIRLKLPIKVVEKGTAASNTSTGSGNVAAPTFSPVSGTYVFPGARIALSSTTPNVSFRSQQGDTNPSVSSGTQGATIAIPSGITSTTYKLNAIAYTSTTAYSPVASATYTVVTNSTKYSITEGSGQSASQSLPASFTGSGDYNSFRALYVDDNFVSEGSYTKTSGSTIVSLSPTYLQTLSAGSHTIKMVYTDGYAEGNFTLTAGATNAVTPLTDLTTTQTSNSTSSGGGRSGVGTDDRSELVIMFVLLGMLIAGFVVSVYYKNEKLRRNRYMD